MEDTALSPVSSGELGAKESQTETKHGLQRLADFIKKEFSRKSIHKDPAKHLQLAQVQKYEQIQQSTGKDSSQKGLQVDKAA